MRHAALVLAMLLAGCSGPAYISPPLIGEATPLRPPEEAWARVLKQFVDDAGRVNYAALAASPQDLGRYVSWVAERDPAAWPDFRGLRPFPLSDPLAYLRGGAARRRARDQALGRLAP